MLNHVQSKHFPDEYWKPLEITQVIATSAIRLGVSKSDVRFVYHIGIPESVHGSMGPKVWQRTERRQGWQSYVAKVYNACKGVHVFITQLAADTYSHLHFYVLNGHSADERNFQILDFFMKNRDNVGQDEVKKKFSSLWRYTWSRIMCIYNSADLLIIFTCAFRFLFSKNCLRKEDLHYFDDECSQTDCYSLGGEICRSMRSCNITMTSKSHDFC